ncbi:hypothetical protein ACFL6U_27075 [Planctomycetota bacterium]
MKDSKVYADKVKKLHQALKKAYGKVEPVRYDDPVDALVYAMMSEPISERKAQTASKRFAEYFVDLNDLRVSRPEEIAEVIGQDSEAIRDMAAALSQALSSVFNAHHVVTLMELTKLGKRPAKQALEDINGITHFAISYCMVTALQSHAIPLTGRMIDYLKSEEYVHPSATPEVIEGFLSKQITAKDNYEFYFLLRTECESAARSRKIKTKTKKKTVKKKVSPKKTTPKKTTQKTAVKKKTVQKKTASAKKKTITKKTVKKKTAKRTKTNKK